jgi:hypothetical protein
MGNEPAELPYSNTVIYRITSSGTNKTCVSARRRAPSNEKEFRTRFFVRGGVRISEVVRVDMSLGSIAVPRRHSKSPTSSGVTACAGPAE